MLKNVKVAQIKKFKKQSPFIFCTTSALLLHYFCTNSALLLHYFCTTSALLHHYFTTTSALLGIHQSFAQFTMSSF